MFHNSEGTMRISVVISLCVAPIPHLFKPGDFVESAHILPNGAGSLVSRYVGTESND